MLGQMMQQPLLISTLLDHAQRHHGEQEIVSRRVEGDLHRYRFRDLAARSRRLAKALLALGMREGTRVGTLAWNGYRHMELYFGVSGAGGVVHTLNPRLHPEHLVYIAGHAEDHVLCFDRTFLPLVEGIATKLAGVKHFVLLAGREGMPASSPIPGLLCYEDLLAEQDDDFEWPIFDENTASSLCYTSGTTGRPKGALYSHRSTVLHSYAVALPDSLGLSACDTILPVVPMFHVNAWGLPYVACMVGSRVVFPGPALDGKSLYELFESERVTVSAGVPTVWQGLLAHVEANRLEFHTMRRTVIGGAACPPAMLQAFRERYGVHVIHAWGMTETSPVATVCTLKSSQIELAEDAKLATFVRQGRSIYGIDMKIVDPAGAELPWDGKAFGELLVRGPWIVERYFKDEGGSPLRDGWFATGDIATIDANGFMHITDRAKDLIKSGGEWIGSVEIENVAVSHPKVAMAACVGVPHPKWDERPLLVVQCKPGMQATREEILAHFQGRVAKWWIPDDVVFVEALPLGATGKLLKTKLREQYRDHRLPSVER